MKEQSEIDNPIFHFLICFIVYIIQIMYRVYQENPIVKICTQA